MENIRHGAKIFPHSTLLIFYLYLLELLVRKGQLEHWNQIIYIRESFLRYIDLTCISGICVSQCTGWLWWFVSTLGSNLYYLTRVLQVWVLVCTVEKKWWMLECFIWVLRVQEIKSLLMLSLELDLIVSCLTRSFSAKCTWQ